MDTTTEATTEATNDLTIETASSASPDLLAFACPRCGRTVEERFYGPCGPCRTELRDTVAGEQRAVEAPAYEPKLNVTPNAVAVKE